MKVAYTLDYKTLNEGLKKYEAKLVEDKDLSDEFLNDVEVFVGKLTPQQLSKCKNLKLYQHIMAGSDLYKKEMFPDGCIACNATGSFGIAIAEYTIASIVYMMRAFKQYTLNQRDSKWQRFACSDSIYGSTVLMLGLGDLGKESAVRLKAMGAKILGIRRHKDDKPEYCDECGDLNDLNDFLSRADIVVNTLPQSDKTKYILGKEQFAVIKEGAYFVNVGRGTAVDNDAMIEALNNGKLKYAALDVFEKEPLDESSPLWTMENVLVLPHNAGAMDLTVTKEKFSEITLHNIDALVNGGEYINEIDFETGYRKYIKK